MKKIIILFLFLAIVFPAISALELNMDSTIPKGETVIASLSGNFLDSIERENIRFYRGHVLTSFSYDVAKINNIYYIVFQTQGKNENNYSINITGVRYIVDSQISEEQISKKFEIVSGDVDFSINPGFIIENDNFSISIQNLKSSSITISLVSETLSGNSEGDFKFVFWGGEVEDEIILPSGALRNLNVIIDELSGTTIRNLILSTGNTEYKIPCYIIVQSSSELPPEEEEEETIENEPPSEEENEMPSEEEYNVSEENCTFFQILFGTCGVNEKQNETSQNETFENKTTNTTKENISKTDYEIIRQGNQTIAIKDGKVLNQTATFKTCSQIEGIICPSDKVCSNSTIYAKDGQCCLSECVKKETSPNKKIIGWAIIILLILIILWFFINKFKGTTKKRDTLLNPRGI